MNWAQVYKKSVCACIFSIKTGTMTTSNDSTMSYKSTTQDEIARIRKRKRGRNMLNRSGNTTDNLCFRYRFRDVFSRFRCCVYNGTGPLFVHVKHNRNMELHVSATFQKYGNMWFRPVQAGVVKCFLSFFICAHFFF